VPAKLYTKIRVLKDRQFYVARRETPLSRGKLEVVQYIGGYIYRAGVQRGYLKDEWILYKRVRLSEGLY